MVEIVKDLGELRSIRRQWNELADLMRNPLLRYEWIITAVHSLFTPGEVYFFIYREQEKVHAIAPLVKIGSGLRQKLILVGYPYLYEPADFLYRDQRSLEVIMQAIARQTIPVYFQRIPGASPVLGCKHWRTGKWMFKAKAVNQSSSQYLSIAASWDEFYSSLTSKNRNDLRRAYRKAEKKGAVSFDFISVDRQTNAGYFQRHLVLEKKSWKARNRTAITNVGEWERFYSAMTPEAADNGSLYYAHMKIDDQLIAGQFFLVQYDKLWTLKIAHDDAYAFCSPGVLLMNEVVRFAFDKGLQGVEFLGSSELWLKKWTSGFHYYVDFVYFPFSFGSAIRILIGLKSRIFRKLKRLLLKIRGV
jgi:predicted N-acyltransferase